MTDSPSLRCFGVTELWIKPYQLHLVAVSGPAKAHIASVSEASNQLFIIRIIQLSRNLRSVRAPCLKTAVFIL
jgi:hypothetical protein